MRLYAIVKTFQGVVEGVELFLDEKEAEKAFEEYTEHPFDGFYTETGCVNERYDGTKIFEVELPIPELKQIEVTEDNIDDLSAGLMWLWGAHGSLMAARNNLPDKRTINLIAEILAELIRVYEEALEKFEG